METVTNYWLLWTVYLLASAVFFVAFWRLTRFTRFLWLSYLLRAITIALAFTPWYANQQGTVLAPALIIVMLDAITIGGTAAVRGLVPLLLALILALVIAIIWHFISVRKINNSVKKQKVTINKS